MDDSIKDRLTRLETNMEWIKRQQYMLLGTQMSMIIALLIRVVGS